MRISGIAVLVMLAGVQSAWPRAQKPQSVPGPRASVRHGAGISTPPVQSPRPTPATPTPRPAPRPAPSRTFTPPTQDRAASPFDAGPFTYAPRYKPWQHPRMPHNWGSGYYGYTVPFEVVEAQPEAEHRAPATEDQLTIGGVDLDVEPRNAAVYVDGFYVGMLGDFAANGLPLRAGRHWIDLRAESYETLTIPVDIIAGQLATYRGELTVARQPQVNTASSRGPQTMFVIPGCYAGNRPPVESTLPKGCDTTLLRTLTLY